MSLAILSLTELAREASLGSDIHNLASSAGRLDNGRLPSPTSLMLYPLALYVVYMPLGLVPPALAQAMTQVASVAALVWIIRIWAGDERGSTSLWTYALLLSPPALDLIYIDQFNTVASLLMLTAILLLMDHGRVTWLAGLSTAALLAKPFAAIPALPAMASLEARWKRIVAVLGGTILIGCLVMTIAQLFDRGALTEVTSGLAQRPLIGVPAVARELLGKLGVISLLVVWAGVEILIARVISARSTARDTAAVIIALSVVPLHLGGPYVAVFLFPALVRLTARRASLLVPVAFTSIYSLVTLVQSLVPAILPTGTGLGPIVVGITIILVVVFPVIAALGVAAILVREINHAVPRGPESSMMKGATVATSAALPGSSLSADYAAATAGTPARDSELLQSFEVTPPPSRR